MTLRRSRSRAALALVGCLGAVALAIPSASVAAPLVWSAPAQVDTDGTITALSCPTTSFCAAVDNAGNLLTGDPASTTWPATATDTASLLSVSCGSASFCAAGDVGGRTMSYGNGAWGLPIAPPGQRFAITAMSCATSLFCLAGTEVTTTPKTLDGGATWVTGNTQGVDYPGSINAVSCVPGADGTTGFCVVVDSSNAALVSSDSGSTFLPGDRTQGVISGASQLTSVSCTSSTACVTVDGLGHAFYYRGGVAGGTDWTSVDADLGRQLTSVACVPGSVASQTFCAAVDAGGYELETADGGATWSTPVLITGTTGTPPLTAISCPATTFCVATDNAGNAYTATPLAPPVNTGTAPTVSNGPAQVGQAPPLSCSDSGVAWSGPTPTVSYRWQRSVPSSGVWTDIALDGDAQSYSPVADDVGDLLRCVVTAANAAGNTDADSAATEPVLAAAAPPAPAPTTTTTTTGTPPPSTTLAGPPPPPMPPSNLFGDAPVRLGAHHHLVARYVLPGPGELEVIGHHHRRGSERRTLYPAAGRIVIARATRIVHAAGGVTIELALSRTGLRMLRRNHHLHVVITARFTPAGGTAKELWRTVLVRQVGHTARWTVSDVTDAG